MGHTATPALTQEHQARLHSAAVNAVADTEVLTTAHGHPFIKPEPVDPSPVKFTGNLGVIDDELEIINFIPAWEVSHTGCQVKQEPPECVSCLSQAALHSHPTGEVQGQSDAPSPTVGCVRADLSD